MLGKTNVLFLTEYFFPFVHGGAELSVDYLAKGLKKSNAYTVTILTPNYGRAKAEESRSGVSIKRYEFYGKLKKNDDSLTNIWFANPVFLIYLVIIIGITVLKKRIDVIHVHGQFSIPSAVIAGKIFHKPVVITFRDWQVLCNYGECLMHGSKTCSLRDYFLSDFRSYWFQKVTHKTILNFTLQLTMAVYGRIQRNFIKFFASLATVRIAISNYQRDVYSFNKLEISKRIYNSMEFVGIPDVKTAKQILFSGRLTLGKGIDLLLKSFALVREKYPHISLIIMGSGKKLIRRAGIQYLGWIEPEDRVKYMAKSLVIVQPSVFKEPFGRTALDALSLGVPAVVTNRGGLPEIIENDITGYVVSPDEKQLAAAIINGIKNNVQLRKNISSKYASLRNKFEIEPIKQYMEIYRSLL